MPAPPAGSFRPGEGESQDSDEGGYSQSPALHIFVNLFSYLTIFMCCIESSDTNDETPGADGAVPNTDPSVESLRADLVAASSNLTYVRQQLASGASAESALRSENLRLTNQLGTVMEQLRDAGRVQSDRSRALDAAAAISMVQRDSLSDQVLAEVDNVGQLKERLAILMATHESLKRSTAMSEAAELSSRREIADFQRQLLTVNARNADLERQLALREHRLPVPLDGVGAAPTALGFFAAANLRRENAVGQAAPVFFAPHMVDRAAVPLPMPASVEMGRRNPFALQHQHHPEYRNVPRPPSCNNCRRVGHRSRECPLPVTMRENRGSRSAGPGN